MYSMCTPTFHLVFQRHSLFAMFSHIDVYISRPGESWRKRRLSWNVRGRTNAAFDCRYCTAGEMQQLLWIWLLQIKHKADHVGSQQNMLNTENATEWWRQCAIFSCEVRVNGRLSSTEESVWDLALTTTIIPYIFVFCLNSLFPLPVDFARE